jgi:uncharacterized protein
VTSPYLSRINYYPFKSLDGQTVERARLLPSGAIEHDRQFAMFDASGKVIDGKRMAAVHRLRTEYDPDRRFLTLLPDPGVDTLAFHVDRQRKELEKWLTEYFGLESAIRIEENASGGFPDDVVASGPTIISMATLQAVASWFPGMTVEEARARFRPSLEIGGVAEFWEDQLFAGKDESVALAVGEAQLEGVYPCPRCVVPTRWSQTGEVGPEAAFAKIFAERRKETLPSWVHTGHFDHYYRLAVNTRPVRPLTVTIQVGDEVRILS